MQNTSHLECIICIIMPTVYMFVVQANTRIDFVDSDHLNINGVRLTQFVNFNLNLQVLKRLIIIHNSQMLLRWSDSWFPLRHKDVCLSKGHVANNVCWCKSNWCTFRTTVTSPQTNCYCPTLQSILFKQMIITS